MSPIFNMVSIKDIINFILISLAAETVSKVTDLKMYGYEKGKMNRTHVWIQVARLILQTPSPQNGIFLLVENRIGDQYVESVGSELGPITIVSFSQIYRISLSKVKLLIIILENVEIIFNEVIENKMVLRNVDSVIVLKSQVDSYEDNFLEIWRAMNPRGYKVARLYNGNMLIQFPHPIHYCTELQCDFIVVDHSNIDYFRKLLSTKVINMHGREMKISMFERVPTATLLPDGNFTGFDQEILNIVRDKMNFTVSIVPPKYPNCRYLSRSKDGTYCGALSDLIYDVSYVCFNNMFLKNYGLKNLTFTVSVGYDKLCVVVPPARPLPQWLVLFSTFELDEWLYIIVMYNLCTLILYCMEKVTEPPLFNSFMDSTFVAFALIIQSPVNRLARTDSVRIATITVSLSGFLITIYFQASLLTMLTTDVYEREIDTLEQLDRSGLKIYSSSLNLKDTFSPDSPITRSLAKKFVLKEDSATNHVGLVAEGERLAAIGRKFDFGGKFGLDYRTKIHLVEDCPRLYFLVYPLPHLSPYIESMNSILGRLQDSGVLRSHFVSYSFSPLAKMKRHSTTTNNFYPLNFDNLKILFLILVIGCATATVVFVVENIYAVKHKRFRF